MLRNKRTGLVFYTRPWRHQLDATAYLVKHGSGALYTDMGSGKTKIMIDTILNRGFKRVLIIAPKRVCAVWISEITKHLLRSPNIASDVSGLSSQAKVLRLSPILSESEIPIQIIVNYDSVWREPFRSLVLKTKWDAVVCDESHRIKSPGSKCSKFLEVLGRRVSHRFLVTGTVMAQKPTDVYAQYRFLDPRIFGTNYYKFCQRYENIDIGATTAAGYKVLNKRTPYINLDELHDKIFSVAFKCDSDLDLPQQHHIYREYTVASEVQKAYDKIKKDGVFRADNGVLTVENPLALFTRLQQLMSGYVQVQDELKNTHTVKIDDERTEQLKELILDLADEPIVVFARFRQDFTDISNMLDSINISYGELSGKKDDLKDWQDGKMQVLIVQPQAGAEGITLVRAKYAIYYSKHPSLGLYQQSLKRLHRPGQTQNVTYYHIIGKLGIGRSLDEKLLSAHASGKELIDLIMEEGL